MRGPHILVWIYYILIVLTEILQKIWKLVFCNGIHRQTNTQMNIANSRLDQSKDWFSGNLFFIQLFMHQFSQIQALLLCMLLFKRIMYYLLLLLCFIKSPFGVVKKIIDISRSWPIGKFSLVVARSICLWVCKSLKFDCPPP